MLLDAKIAERPGFGGDERKIQDSCNNFSAGSVSCFKITLMPIKKSFALLLVMSFISISLVQHMASRQPHLQNKAGLPVQKQQKARQGWHASSLLSWFSGNKAV